MSETIQSKAPEGAESDAGPAEELTRVEPFRLAKTTAVSALAKQLEERFDMTAAAAETIAYAVEDPAEARRQLQNPGTVRVPRGSLRTITARVSVLHVVPHLVNGRVVGATPYPASVHSGDAPPKFWAERDIRASKGELVLKANTKQDVIDGLVDASRELLAQNDLSASVREVGVVFPIVVLPMTITASDAAPRTVLTAVEGSSRVATTHRITGTSPAEIVFGSLAEPRAARGRMQEFMAKLEMPLDSVTSEDLAKARAASVPATVIVGFDPDDPSVDLLHAVDRYVAFLHLDPPKQWTEPAKENKLADAIVDELANARELTPTEADWFAGMLSPQDAQAAGLPRTADSRGGRILRKLSAPAGSSIGVAVGRGIRRFTLQQRASRHPKSLAAASLALRAYPSARKATTSILARVWSYKPFWNNTWRATDRTLEDLRDAALAEIQKPGPSSHALELAVYATYWLVTSGALGTEEPGSVVRSATTDQPRPADKREPQTVLDATIRSRHGIQFLYQASLAGRLGIQPPRVDERGTVVVSAAGSPMVATNAWVRETFRPAAPVRKSAPSDGAVVPTESPDHALDAAIDSLDRDVDAVVARMRAIESIAGPGGVSHVDAVGIDSPRAADLTAKLNSVIRQITRYEVIWEARNPDLADTGDPDDDEDGADEAS